MFGILINVWGSRKCSILSRDPTSHGHDGKISQNRETAAKTTKTPQVIADKLKQRNKGGASRIRMIQRARRVRSVRGWFTFILVAGGVWHET